MAVVPYPLQDRRVFVAGHRGLVGRALCRRLAREPVALLTVDRAGLDLRDGDAVRSWMEAQRPHVVILAAARVGGILANATRPVDFLEDNLRIELAVLHAAFEVGVEKLLFLGSSCIYPRDARQPIREEDLLAGALEDTNRAYAIAKIAGLELCRAYRRQYGVDFVACMPSNLYGPFDRFDLTASHVLPALLRKAELARQVAEGRLEAVRADERRFGPIPAEVLDDLGLLRDGDRFRRRGSGPVLRVWGSGRPRREFLHVDDLADACLFLLRHWSDEIAPNVGTGTDVSIAELARLVCDIVGFPGPIVFDPARPDGTPRKLLDVSRLGALGWRAGTPLAAGIRSTLDWYRAEVAAAAFEDAATPRPGRTARFRSAEGAAVADPEIGAG